MHTKTEKTFLLEFQAQTDRPETMQYFAKEEAIEGFKVYTSFVSKQDSYDYEIPNFKFQNGGFFLDKNIDESINYFIDKFKEQNPSWTIGLTKKETLFPAHEYQVQILE